MPTRSVLLRATLITDITPLPNKTIRFYYLAEGATDWTLAGSATTNADGVAEVTVSLVVPANYQFKATFEGDYDYEPSEAVTDVIRIKAKTTISLVVTPQ
jgi:hypothetical protein